MNLLSLIIWNIDRIRRNNLKIDLKKFLIIMNQALRLFEVEQLERVAVPIQYFEPNFVDVRFPVAVVLVPDSFVYINKYDS